MVSVTVAGESAARENHCKAAVSTKLYRTSDQSDVKNISPYCDDFIVSAVYSDRARCSE